MMHSRLAALALLTQIVLTPAAAQTVPQPPDYPWPDVPRWTWDGGDLQLEDHEFKLMDDYEHLKKVCFDSASSEEVRIFACGAFQYLIEIFYLAGQCFGIDGEPMEQRRLHSCKEGSSIPVALEWWLE